MRIARNTGWLATARGITGLLSIIYLGLASRTLGLEDFGTFALILTYGQLITNLVQFQSVKGVIRYGALHLESKPARLARLVGAMAAFDGLGILFGSLVAIAAVPIAGHLFHWTGDRQIIAAVFSVALMFGTGGTPCGVLRLEGRFDTLAVIEALGPVIRLAGALIGWLTGGGIASFLAVWAISAIIQNLAQWFAAVRRGQTGIKVGPRAFRGAVRENEGLWRFMLMTNFSNSLTLFWMQLGTLAVGAVAGPAQAGGFRIAQRIAAGIGNPFDLIARALYPEFARLMAYNKNDSLDRLLTRIMAAAAALGALVVVIVIVGGKLILDLVAGAQFEFAYLLLVLLSVSTAIDLGAFALDPYLTAQGRAGRILRIRLVGALTYTAIVALALPRMGSVGAAIAAIGASAIMFAQLALSVRQPQRLR